MVDGFALTQNAAGHQDIFGADLLRFGQQGGVGFIIEGQLDNAGAIAQIDKDQRTHIACFLCPAAYHHFPADHFRGDGAAVVGAFKTFHGICHKFCTPFVLGNSALPGRAGGPQSRESKPFINN